MINWIDLQPDSIPGLDLYTQWRLSQQRKKNGYLEPRTSWKPTEYNYYVSLFQQQQQFDYSAIFKEPQESVLGS